MIVVRIAGNSKDEFQAVEELLLSSGEIVHRVDFPTNHCVVALEESGLEKELIEKISIVPNVLHVAHLATPYVLAARGSQKDRTVVQINDRVAIGATEFTVMAGPCTVENKKQVEQVADAVERAGARILRGGAFKPRTSPFSFQGLGHKGVDILAKVGKKTGMPIVTEITGPHKIELLDKNADIIQVGMRNTLNYELLKELGGLKSQKPILLKCGIGTSLDEFLAAADYILSEGNPNVILCLRGTIGFSLESRSAINMADIPALRRRTHLPIVIDPSHVAGKWGLVPAVAASALVAGADGLLIEVHNDPGVALVDGPQSLTPDRFDRLMYRLRAIAPAMGRTIAPASNTVKRPAGAHPLHDLCLEEPGRIGDEENMHEVDENERSALVSFLTTKP